MCEINTFTYFCTCLFIFLFIFGWVLDLEPTSTAAICRPISALMHSFQHCQTASSAPLALLLGMSDVQQEPHLRRCAEHGRDVQGTEWHFFLQFTFRCHSETLEREGETSQSQLAGWSTIKLNYVTALYMVYEHGK